MSNSRLPSFALAKLKMSRSSPTDAVQKVANKATDTVSKTTDSLSNTAGGLLGGQKKKEKGGGGKGEDQLRLRLDLNLEIEIHLTAKIHGDLTIGLL